MERIVEQNLLYDFYGELLTAHQMESCFIICQDLIASPDHVMHCLSSNSKLSCNLRSCHIIQNMFAINLHLVAKFLTAKEKIKEIHTLSRRLLREDKEQMKEDIRQIESVCNQVLEDL